MTSEDVSNEPEEQPVYHRSIFGVYQQKLIYSNVIFIGFFHILTLYILLIAPYIEQWHVVLFNLAIGSLGGLGVTAAAHRYYTHRAFKAKPPVLVMFLIMYAMAGHNKLYDWVRDHRVHHKFSETDADPHNSKRGFFFAHVGWLMMKKHPDVYSKGKSVDLSDIANDPLVTWYDRHFILMKIIFCFALPTVIPPLFWNACWHCSFMATIVRYILSLNFTWLVNSAAHLYGYRPYDRRIRSGDNLLVSILSYGEGWHNYHHTFPWDYRASELGKLNPTTRFLNFLAKMGWCYDMKHPSDELIRQVALKYGDGSFMKSGSTELVIDESLAEKISKMST